MKLKLYSDFIDYYDHHFDIDGEKFVRFSTGGMNRIEMFDFLKLHKYDTPEYGTVKELLERLDMKFDLVVYTDIRSHCGEGKVLMCVEDAIKKYPNDFASVYISDQSTSYRHLQIGNKLFWLKYISFDDWRSNCGNVKISIEDCNDGYHKSIKYPLFAIDFVPVKAYGFVVRGCYENRLMYEALDFNISPQIRGTGVENILEPGEVVSLIKQFYSDNQNFKISFYQN